MVKVIIYLPKELSHSSYIHTGLFELERLGLIKCKISMKFRKDLGRISLKNDTYSKSSRSQPKTSFYELFDEASKQKIFFATDCYDIPYYFSTVALDKCDYVFKRNFSQHYIAQLPACYKKKIYPMGITFKVKSTSFKKRGLIEFGSFGSNLYENFKLDRLILHRISNIIKSNLLERKRLKNTPKLDTYDQYIKNTENKIIYQKRFFPYELNSDTRDIHLQRFKFVKKLK